MLKILLASRNAGKLREFAELLLGVTLVPWPAEAPELPETGAFFQDNALQKAEGARAWWRAHGTEPVDGVLADDSGLCVDALWGGPGVLRARFAPDLRCLPATRTGACWPWFPMGRPRRPVRVRAGLRAH